MSRGRAIIEARMLLGNSGAIRKRGNDYCMGTDNGDFRLIAWGRDWRDALRDLRKKLGK